MALSKDSRVGDSGVMLVKGSDTPVSTGAAMVSWDLSQLHRMAPDEAAQMTTFTIDAANSSTVYRVGQPVRCQGSARGRA